MHEIRFIEGPKGHRLAYSLTQGTGPLVVFLPGYKSDMEGTKAVHLEDWARDRGRAFLRLDYSGHGQSGGAFEEGCIGDWAADAEAVISAVWDGPVVLVGSSMGGWIGLLLARRMSALAGFVGIAAAPDFTEDGFWAGFSAQQQAQLMADGIINLPSEYGDDYVVTKRLIEDGRENLVLRSPLRLPCAVRLLQGTQDNSVSRDRALALLDHIEAPDVRLTLQQGADHSFSDPACLTMIEQAILQVTPD